MEKYLFDCLDQIKNSIDQAEKVLLLIDYDGTLVPIAQRPEMAIMPERVRNLLLSLRDHPRVILGIISGRALADIKRLVAINNVIYVGNHGLEMDLFSEPYTHPDTKRFLPPLRELKERLSIQLKDFPGSFLEDKGLILSIHYRNLLPEMVGSLKRLLEDLMVEYYEGLEITQGKKVWEIRPKISCNKGTAVKTILKFFAGKKNHFLPIYLGDDSTDEDAFEALRDVGITIRIANGFSTSKAQFYLTRQEGVIEFLGFLYNYLRL
jgi:trehalose-phosphatase